MLSLMFTGLINSEESITAATFFICLAVALGLGFLIAFMYTYKATYTKSFVVTLATLPAVVCIVILMVNGNLGTGVAVAGTFSLVRFRSLPGTAKEIGAIFQAMSVGLICGMGYPVAAVVFAVIMCGVNYLYLKSDFGVCRTGELEKTLVITMPEDLDYSNVFDDIFKKYTNRSVLVRVKTTNLGSLNRLTYDIELRTTGIEKSMIDELRCRNGNLEISISAKDTEASTL